MKKYLNPKLELVEIACADILTLSNDLVERPIPTNPNEVPGVPLG